MNYPKMETGPERVVFTGHIHPVFTSYGKGRQRFRLPCFFVGPTQVILPSFGVFTGGFNMHLIDNRKIYMTTESKIFAVC